MPELNQMKLLISLAQIDGKVADRERNYIINIGRANGIYPDQVVPLFTQRHDVIVPQNLNNDQKFDYIFSLVQLMKIDERMYREEILFCSTIASNLGYDKEVMFELMLHVKSATMKDDEVLAIKELAKKYSWLDISRVGIFGHSAGGYDAGHAMLEFPDFYKVAVASSADHDFRMEKDWWPEMYMGWPVDSTYNEVSNITMAKNLKGKLLIVHGGIDENVNPSATFKLAEALVKADKEFDMLIFPSQHHGYMGKVAEYFNKKLWNYFVEHLQEVKPIWDYQLSQ